MFVALLQMQPLQSKTNSNEHRQMVSTQAVNEMTHQDMPKKRSQQRTSSSPQEQVLFDETKTFQELNLHENVLRALQELGYKHPSLIQAQAIPPALNKEDILGTSQTGSGKTAAFALPIIELLLKNKDDNKKPRIQALILAPTRELAVQIHKNFMQYSKYTPIKVACVYGGVSQRDQVNALRKGIHVLVATPGRLLDLHNQGHVNFKETNILVLDEADRMLDMGFLPDIKRIVKLLPRVRQTLFFSATMPDQVQDLANELLHKPVNVSINTDQFQVDSINSMIYFVEKTEKYELLTHVLRHENIERALIFTRMKRTADWLARTLESDSFKADSIHGDKSQAAREKALRKFKTGKINILVATDVVARGIDVEDISHVINYELPDEPEMYVHRVGRTGRAGKPGIAITFCSREENTQFIAIELLLQDHIPRVHDHPYAMRTPPQLTDLTQEIERPTFQNKKRSNRHRFNSNHRSSKNRSNSKSRTNNRRYYKRKE